MYSGINPAIRPFLIEVHATVLDAMRQLEDTAQRILFVVDDGDHLIGSLTDGDNRRWILAGGDLHGSVDRVCNRTPFHAGEDYRLADMKRAMRDLNIGCIPVVDRSAKVVDLLFWEGVFGTPGKEGAAKRHIDLPVVIMAGGKGTRLDPFTRVLPKPLLPMGDKTVIEHIIDSFRSFGVPLFYLSLNEKAKIIKSFFEELDHDYEVRFIEESEPLGTAGSLRYLRGELDGSFIVTNCDVIVTADYGELVEFHQKSGNDITVVGSLKQYRIPYGVCKMENGILTGITEKPEYHFLVNTGMYILQSASLELIPEHQPFHMTELIGKVRDSGGRVAAFPVSDKAWIDTGEWAEYRNALKQLRVDE